MKPRTTVPAALVVALKRYSFVDNNRALATEVLMFDGDCSDLGARSPLHLAHALLRVSKILARDEKAQRIRATASAESWLLGARVPAVDVAGDVLCLAENASELRDLQRRVWRAIEGLMLAARGGVGVGARG